MQGAPREPIANPTLINPASCIDSTAAPTVSCVASREAQITTSGFTLGKRLRNTAPASLRTATRNEPRRLPFSGRIEKGQPHREKECRNNQDQRDELRVSSGLENGFCRRLRVHENGDR